MSVKLTGMKKLLYQFGTSGERILYQFGTVIIAGNSNKKCHHHVENRVRGGAEVDERLEKIIMHSIPRNNGVFDIYHLRDRDYKYLVQQAEKVPELEEYITWLAKIRELIHNANYPEGVLEYAIAYPEGIYDMVRILYERNHLYEQAINGVTKYRHVDEGLKNQLRDILKGGMNNV